LTGLIRSKNLAQFWGDLRQIDAMAAELNLQSFKVLWSYPSDSNGRLLITNKPGGVAPLDPKLIGALLEHAT
jgi:hypothetical protein